jgi:transcriptional regulator with XRE-family HTH domain
MSWKEYLGAQIRAERSRVGLSLEGLADRLSVSRVQLGNYEKGKSAIPVNILTEIAQALKVESFTVDGYKVVPHDGSNSPPPTEQQLSFPFGQSHRFRSASVRIDSGADDDGDIIVTAIFKGPRSA